MATEILSKSIPPEPVDHLEEITASDAVVDLRLSETRRQLRSVDLVAGLLWLACATIGWFLIVTIVDQWLVEDGLSQTSRWAALLLFLFGGAAFSFLAILRPLLRRVNPIYVAHRIEQTNTSAKNSLINFLLLRRTKEAVTAEVFDAVKKRAAGDIQKVTPDEAIDWGPVIRIAYLFTALFALGAIYQLVSPKNPIVSVARALVPWSDRAVPTRVTFSEITPGNLDTFYGQRIVVSAEVSGLHDHETPTLYYTTADNQTVDQTIPMSRPEDKYRYECTIPPGQDGIQQDLTYYLVAGDGRSPTFTIHAEAPPAIAVETVRYDYPTYTGQEPKTVTGVADLVAIEGTKVTLKTKANRAIDHAEIDLGCDHLRGIPMTVDDRAAVGSWILDSETDRTLAAEQQSYQILFTDTQGNKNPTPVRYTIRMIPDQMPTVRMINPPDDAIELPENGRLELTVAAEDPDFGLRSVRLEAKRDGRGLLLPPMLDVAMAKPSPQKTYQGVFVFEPAQLGLKPGDEIEYWAEAKDIKVPNANVAQTEKRRILIVEEDRGQRTEDSKDKPQNQGDQQGQEQQQQNQGDQQGQEQQQQGEGEQKGQDQQQQGEGEQKGQDQQQQGKGDQQGQDQQQQGKGDQQGQDQQQQGKGDQQGQDQQQQGKGEKQGQDQQQQGKGDQQGQDQQQQGKGDQQGQDQKGNKEGTDDTREETPSEPIDGETRPGDVFEKVLQRCDQGQCDQPKDGTSGSEQKQDATNQTGDSPGKGDDTPKVNQFGQPIEDKPDGAGAKDKSENADDNRGNEKQGPGDSTDKPKSTDPQDGTAPGEGSGGELKEPNHQDGTPSDGTEASDKPGTPGSSQGKVPQGAKPVDPSEQGPPKNAQATPEEFKGKGTPMDPNQVPEDVPPSGEASPGEKPNGSMTGGTGAGPGEMKSPPGDLIGPDPFDKEAADRKTALALEYLKDQLAKEKPDPDLLESLGGWTRDDLDRFVQRWESMRNAAKQPDRPNQDAAQRYEEALRSLGLPTGHTELEADGTSEYIENVRQSRDTRPPQSWQDRINAYQRSIGSK